MNNKKIRGVSKNKINLIVLIITIIFTLIFLEAINYIFASKKDYYSVWPPRLKQKFFPNSSIMKGIEGTSEFTINELGYRGPLIKDKEKEYRILIVGGSTSECLYLGDSETWPNLIMEKLNKTNDGKKVVVLNIGKSGHNTRDHIFQLKYLTKDYEPDLIILMIGANDMLYKLSKRWVWKPFDENSYDESKSFYYTPKYGKESTLLYKMYKYFNQKFNSNIKPQDEFGKNMVQQRTERKNSNNLIYGIPDLEIPLEDYKKNLNRIIKISRENKVDIIFATQPFLWKENMTEEEDSSLWMSTDFNGNFYPTETMIDSMNKFNTKLLKVCLENRDIVCLDLEKKIEKSLDFFYDDMHFNEKGAEYTSKIFTNFIRENFEEFKYKEYLF